MDVSETELQSLYTWVDEIPLSRPKRNIARDFADGVLLAEIVHHYFPKLVELHNYSSANGLAQKLYNWSTLNQKVFKRIGFVIAKSECEAVANCEPGAVERVLKLTKVKIAKATDKDAGSNGENDQEGVGGDYEIGAGGILLHYASSPPTQQHSYPSKPTVNAFATLKPKTLGSTQDKLTGQLLADKEQTILELRATNEILETKVQKLEQLVRLKDAKIQTLLAKMQAAGMT